MTHLTFDALARLDGGDPPTPDERGHLTSCAQCRDELTAFASQREALAALPRTKPPSSWSTIEARLEAAGLVSTAQARPHRRVVRELVAAALLLAVGAAGGISVDHRRAAADDLARDDRELGASGATDDARLAEALAAVAASSHQAVVDTVSRLAALQAIVLTTGEALRAAPEDPLISGYHRAATVQRDALVDRVTGRSLGALRWF